MVFYLDQYKRHLFKKNELQLIFLKTLQILYYTYNEKVSKTKIIDIKDDLIRRKISFLIKKIDIKSSSRNICLITKRQRSVLSTYGVSRIQLRKLLHLGFFYGLRKASW